ncbi:MAG TPA: glycosyltransferase [Arachnia sp.]|nr:glycosyltransferase [Arachnia sp.]HMT85148.1 glycosyltransferase [Arachnia sp.]
MSLGGPEGGPEGATKYAVFVPSMAGGGAERVMATVANQLALLGYEVDLILASRSGPYLREIVSQVSIVDLGASRTARATIPLAKYLREHRPAAVLSAMPHANMTAILANKLAGSPSRVVASERDVVKPVPKRIGPRFLRWLTSRIYRNADLVIAVSDGVRQDVLRELVPDPAKVRTIYNPVDLDEIRARAAEPVSHPWLKDRTVPMFLAVGRLERVKGFDILLKAFAEVRGTNPSRLVIIGEGSLRSDLESQARDLGIAEFVDLPGFQTNPFAWMARCDVFVLSSRGEGLPNALIQAMACGARVVSTECEHGPAEILAQGRWGQLVPVEDVMALSTAMRSALDSPDSPNVLERANDFSQEELVGQYLQALKSVEEGAKQ